MRVGMRSGLLGIGLAAVVCAAGFGQAASSTAGAPLANGGLLHTLLAAPVVGQPYSARQMHSIVRTLADGTTIKRHGGHFVARDSEGRTRVEMNIARGENGKPNTVLVFVSDPMAHTLSTWVIGPSAKKTASVIKVPEHRADARPAQSTIQNDGKSGPQVTTQNLGTVTLDGLPVTDVKTTVVIPAGRIGNDTPITRTREVWTSDDLKLVMKEQWEDPRNGERTVELEDFSRAEPDPALFRVPAGYEVKTLSESLKELQQKLAASDN